MAASAAPGGDPFAAARSRLAAQLAARRGDQARAGGNGDLRLDDLVLEIAELRPLPAVAVRVLGLGEDDRFSAHELAAIIASDQALTARVLRLANSAYYGYARRITTVRDAVVLVGFRALRSSALTSCVMDALPPSPNLDYQAFWRFSVACGLLAELIGRTEGVPHDHAFTGGVMHGLGLLALDQHRPDALRAVLDVAGAEGLSLPDAERRVLGFTHADLGAALAEHWNFPAELVDAIQAQARTTADPPDRASVAGLVMRARVFARASGLSDGVDSAPPAPEPREEWLMPPLSISLEGSGGIPEILSRVDAFLAAALS